MQKPWPVVFVIYPDIVLLDLAGPVEVFNCAKAEGAADYAYQTAIVSLEGGKVSTGTIISIDSERLDDWRDQDIHTLVIIGGNGAPAAMRDEALVDSISALAKRSQRVCSVCSGALILAATGLLDGRRATTHWEDYEMLCDVYPAVRSEIDPIYVKDGDLWTSAGVTTGIDMALAIVAEDLGRKAAHDVAQALVTYMVRPGGQSQFSPALERQKLDQAGAFEALHHWISENLAQDLRVEALAERAHMSVRSFHRTYSKTMGMTPARAVETFRLEAARELLETTDIGIKSIAARCGFGDEERMRRTFVRLTGIPPTAHRQRFGQVPDTSP